MKVVSSCSEKHLKKETLSLNIFNLETNFNKLSTYLIATTETERTFWKKCQIDNKIKIILAKIYAPLQLLLKIIIDKIYRWCTVDQGSTNF